MKRLYNVQAMRGVAAMLVVLAHLKIPIPIINYSETAPLTHGQAGVDIFFLISGFIMTEMMKAKQDRPFQFLSRRLTRIAPLYWLMTFFIFSAAAAKPNLFPQVSTDVAHLVKSLAFVPQEKSPIVYVGWTLNYEFFFYLLFSVGLLFQGWVRLAPAVGGIAILTLIGMIHGSPSPAWTFYTDPLMIEFVAGIALSIVMPALRGAPVVWLAVLLLAGAAIFVGPYPGPRADRLLYWGAPAAFIMLSALALENSGYKATWRFIQIVGDASYSIYLTHFLVTRAYEKFPVGIDLHTHPGLAVSVAIVVLGLVLAVGVTVHFWIEKPLSDIISRWASRNREASPQLAVP